MYNNSHWDAVISYIHEGLPPLPRVYFQNEDNCEIGSYSRDSYFVHVLDKTKNAYVEVYVK